MRLKPIFDMNATTPTIRVGNCWAKRDDAFQSNGARGGKCRAVRKIADGAVGVVTYGSRTSPQGAYTAAAAADVGTPCVYVTAHGASTPEIDYAEAKGAEVIRVKPGYLSQCKANAATIAQERGYTFVKLSMESEMAMNSTRGQVAGSIPDEAQRIVIVVGGGVSVAGVLHGLDDIGRNIPVLGVRIGRDPARQLHRWCPMGWEWRMDVVTAEAGYDERVDNVWRGITVDPYYEAKCLPYLRPGDLFWIVGIRPIIDGEETAL